MSISKIARDQFNSSPKQENETAIKMENDGVCNHGSGKIDAITDLKPIDLPLPARITPEQPSVLKRMQMLLIDQGKNGDTRNFMATPTNTIIDPMQMNASNGTNMFDRPAAKSVDCQLANSYVSTIRDETGMSPLPQPKDFQDMISPTGLAFPQNRNGTPPERAGYTTDMMLKNRENNEKDRTWALPEDITSSPELLAAYCSGAPIQDLVDTIKSGRNSPETQGSEGDNAVADEKCGTDHNLDKDFNKSTTRVENTNDKIFRPNAMLGKMADANDAVHSSLRNLDAISHGRALQPAPSKFMELFKKDKGSGNAVPEWRRSARPTGEGSTSSRVLQRFDDADVHDGPLRRRSFSPMCAISSSSSSSPSPPASLAGDGPALPHHIAKLAYASGFSENYKGNRNLARNRSAEIPDAENCALWIKNLPVGCTTHELLAAIRNTGGRIYCSVISEADPAAGHRNAAAKVVFFECHAAKALLAQVHSIKHGGPGVWVRGQLVDASYNRIKSREDLAPRRSRVLLIKGPKEFVNERALTAYFETKFVFEIDEVITWLEGTAPGGLSVVEYRFGSYRCQAEAGKLAIMREKADVEVSFGPDPCA